MVGQSDLAFRMMARAHGADLCYTMMINSARFLALDPVRRGCFFQTCAGDRPLIAQLSGDDPATVLAAARLACPAHTCGPRPACAVWTLGCSDRCGSNRAVSS
jgi:tRNA-dihydrouridine synthase 1